MRQSRVRREARIGDGGFRLDAEALGFGERIADLEDAGLPIPGEIGCRLAGPRGGIGSIPLLFSVFVEPACGCLQSAWSRRELPTGRKLVEATQDKRRSPIRMIGIIEPQIR